MDNKLYKDIFYKIKNSSLKNFIKDSNFSKKMKDEFIVLRLTESSQDYDIQIMIWKKVFTNCNIFQVSGHIGNQSFRVFFELDENGIKLFNFQNKESCKELFDNNHKFLEIKDDNLDNRKKIYRDTKKLIRQLKLFLTKLSNQ